MARQHATPIMLSHDGAYAVPLAPLGLAAGAGTVSEAATQRLVHDYPSCVPIAEVESLVLGPVPICTELSVLFMIGARSSRNTAPFNQAKRMKRVVGCASGKRVRERVSPNIKTIIQDLARVVSPKTIAPPLVEVLDGELLRLEGLRKQERSDC